MQEDELLARALRTYTQAEPRPGFEARLLARSRAPRRLRSAWFCAFAMLAAAFALVFWLVPRPRPQIVVRQPPAVPVIRANPPLRAVRIVKAKNRRRSHTQLLLPTPEERSLARLARDAPEETLRAFAELDAHLSADLDIPEIHIDPLQIDNINEEKP